MIIFGREVRQFFPTVFVFGKGSFNSMIFFDILSIRVAKTSSNERRRNKGI